MPTGYTADIPKGISFRQFVMNCARAFGACVDMRDEPMDADIPQEFKPSDHRKKQLEALNLELQRIYSMTNAEADDCAAAEHQDSEAERARYLAEKVRKKEAYEAMLSQVLDWTPPTESHEELKNFMVEQIQSSIKFDCPTSSFDEPAAQMTGSEWRAERIARLKQRIEYHTREQAEEVRRAYERTQWVRNLRDSLSE